jgi:uncharacterized lipoprotein YddW (UPF0748 family)
VSQIRSRSRAKYGLLALAVLAAACGDRGVTEPPPPPPPPDTAAPALLREMRGLWIATVANIDWPSRSSLTADQQRAELVDILARAQATGINTIVFHVRPAGDAVYRSSIEPWGTMLTGTQGSDPGYDPLAFAIDEAHARGMELHAWINPFRAGNTADTTRLAPTHLFHTRRDLVRVYGTQIWMDPGEPDVHDHSMRVIRDIVQRYDVDGIHADDYFYPYVQTNQSGQPIPFPDDATYARYGGLLSRDNWRRANVDAFVERLYREVHALKPTIKVGISPFGIWRPGNPPGITGLDAFATIYADSRKWLQQAWVDYLAPQLYWSIGSPGQSFPALLDWWIAQSTAGRHVWPGLAAYRVNDGTASAFTPQEIPNQITTTRARASGTGHLLYNTTATLKRNNGALASTLAADLYRTAALLPAVPWLDATPPAAPALGLSGDLLQITPAAGEAARWWAVRARATSGASSSWTTRILFGDARTLALDASVTRVLVQAVDRAGNVSAVAEWRRTDTP